MSAAFHHHKLTIGDEHVKEFAIGKRHNRIVIAHEDQRLLLEQEGQGRRAGPSEHAQ